MSRCFYLHGFSDTPGTKIALQNTSSLELSPGVWNKATALVSFVIHKLHGGV
jgi:hypothetical protein